MTDDTPPPDVELTRLADGSLSEPTRSALRARAESSPDLAARLREQEHAVTLMRSTDTVTAPAALRAQVAELTAPRSSKRGGRSGLSRLHPRVFLPVATAVAVGIAALVILAGGSHGPTVGQTARLSLSAAVLPAPAVDPTDRGLLAARVGPVAFPSYARTPGWRATGSRHDRLSGRRVTTVFYRDGGGLRVGYSIVSGPALAEPAGHAVRYGSARYVLASSGRARLVTWRRDGHTCVIAGRGVRPRTLLMLADAEGSTA